MMVHPRSRRLGVAEMLMRLYLRLGWQRVGVIPGYALQPEGGLVDTAVFYKTLRGD
jgi:hypothetical protein